MFHKLFEDAVLHKSPELLRKELLTDYLRMAWFGEGVPPSGADILAQNEGGVCLLQAIDGGFGVKHQSLWPFKGKDFFVVRTNNKVATHTHLQELSPQSYPDLVELSRKGVEAFSLESWSTLVQVVEDYRRGLRTHSLTCEATQNLLTEVGSWPEVEACKGCGALGADTLLLLFDSSQRESLQEKLNDKSLFVIASKLNLSHGIQLHAGGEEVEHFGEIHV